MHAYYLYLALDLARERAAEAEQLRLASLARRGDRRVNRLRRAVARAAVAVARAADERSLRPAPGRRVNAQ